MNNRKSKVAWALFFSLLIVVAFSVMPSTRSLKLTALSACGFCDHTGFPGGLALWVFGVLVFVASARANPFLLTVIATLTYTAYFYVDQSDLLAGNLEYSEEIIFELPSMIWFLGPITIGEYFFYTIIGKLIQFSLVSTAGYVAARQVRKMTARKVIQ